MTDGTLRRQEPFHRECFYVTGTPSATGVQEEESDDLFADDDDSDDLFADDGDGDDLFDEEETTEGSEPEPVASAPVEEFPEDEGDDDDKDDDEDVDALFA